LKLRGFNCTMAQKSRAVRHCWIILAGCDDRVVELCRRDWQRSGVRVVAATSRDHLIECVARHSPDCAVVLSVPNLDADALLTADHIRQIDHSCPLAILTSRVQTDTAVAAMRSGVSDLLDPESPTAEIMASLERVFRRRRYEEHRGGRSMALDRGSLLGTCPAISEIRQRIGMVAASEANVLITGESGTGKELVAGLIHRNSRRKAAPFVAVNCAAIPESLLESELFGHERGAFTGATAARDGKLHAAAAGTLFLDEIGDMSLSAQAKILRAIENRVIQRLGSNLDNPVRFRVVAATNQDLATLTREKRFRQDLYFRLNVVRLELPPLRAHSEDIPEIAEHILRELADRQKQPERRLEGDVLRRLQQHDWPGNVRELRNVLESILVYSSSPSIGLADIPAHIRESLSSHAPVTDERSKILGALTSAEWNRNKACEILQCSRMTLYRKMTRYAIPSVKI
jgi:DNA-binding NtrC family response regulator